MTMSLRNFALLLIPLLLAHFFPKLALSNSNANVFKLLIVSLVIFTIVVTLYIRNLSIEKEVIFKTAELTDTLAKLRESEAKMKTLLVNLNVGIAVFSPKGEMLVCNRKFIELGSPRNHEDNEKTLVEQSFLKQSLIEHLPQVSLEEVITHYINEDGQSLTMDEFPLY
ncbi:hypothetical protein [Desulfosporosinus sp. BICA1-9]|uniref:hypothetical protein n=1 Tax=Desulfosporosinus sp. BICA1-9 TaxID=1531958 RepID=UPI00054BB730|nr:hypothetical protein [Desulfosporosinus sp. BICA1-9]KJS48763.1 MAG: hypothetical protein VR66_12190 [Peptococcaceae bacterium BRH_c23]KJS79882.1 MAG: hypothetical protein JL57_29065 [Desulfosporosinus sp. BICA1-9]